MRKPALALAALLLTAASAFAFKKDKALVVPLKTATGVDAGTATFTNSKSGNLMLTLDLRGIASGDHGVHIHQNPVCDAPDFKTAGGHFNPDGKQHGFENPMGHHNGDLPQNITVSPDGHKVTLRLDSLSMGTGAANDILANGGTSIVVHEKADDMKSDPAGNSGNRIACGIITAAPAK